ncbi:hypothetical protein ACSSS7_004432 [Eimeria intestinalis]
MLQDSGAALTRAGDAGDAEWPFQQQSLNSCGHAAGVLKSGLESWTQRTTRQALFRHFTAQLKDLASAYVKASEALVGGQSLGDVAEEADHVSSSGNNVAEIEGIPLRNSPEMAGVSGRDGVYHLEEEGSEEYGPATVLSRTRFRRQLPAFDAGEGNNVKHWLGIAEMHYHSLMATEEERLEDAPYHLVGCALEYWCSIVVGTPQLEPRS